MTVTQKQAEQDPAGGSTLGRSHHGKDTAVQWIQAWFISCFFSMHVFVHAVFLCACRVKVCGGGGGGQC